MPYSVTKWDRRDKVFLESVILSVTCDGLDPLMHTGNRYDYLRVIIEFKNQKVEVSMFDYLDKMIQEFPEVITGSASSHVSDLLQSLG